MVNRWIYIIIVTLTFFAAVFMARFLVAEPKKHTVVDSIHVLKISSEDGTAVIKTPDGKMQIVHAGDVLLIENNTVRNIGRKSGGQGGTSAEKGSKLKIAEIGKDRVVVEENTDSGTDTIIISILNVKQTIQRISKTSGKPQVLRAPKTEVVKGESGK